MLVLNLWEEIGYRGESTIRGQGTTLEGGWAGEGTTKLFTKVAIGRRYYREKGSVATTQRRAV